MVYNKYLALTDVPPESDTASDIGSATGSVAVSSAYQADTVSMGVNIFRHTLNIMNMECKHKSLSPAPSTQRLIDSDSEDGLDEIPQLRILKLPTKDVQPDDRPDNSSTDADNQPDASTDADNQPDAVCVHKDEYEDEYDDDGIKVTRPRAGPPPPGPPAVTVHPAVRSKQAKQRRRGIAKAKAQPPLKRPAQAVAAPSTNPWSFLSNPSFSTTKEANPRCELMAKCDGQRVHVCTLTLKTHGENFTDICSKIKAEIEKGRMTKEQCLAMRNRLLQ